MNCQNYSVLHWSLAESAWFRRTKDPLGDFSNFATGMPITVNRFNIPSSEHLYQAMRFPHLPDAQFQILDADSPKSCKTIARNFDAQTRDDWMEVRIDIMRWVLVHKIKFNAKRMAKAFRLSAGRPILEFSKRDSFWGAQPFGENEMVVCGQNVLGCLLTELRDRFTLDPLMRLDRKPCFPRALLMGSPI